MGKRRRYVSGSSGMGMTKHRVSGWSGVSRRTKMAVERDANQPKQKKQKSKMFESVAELFKKGGKITKLKKTPMDRGLIVQAKLKSS